MSTCPDRRAVGIRPLRVGGLACGLPLLFAIACGMPAAKGRFGSSDVQSVALALEQRSPAVVAEHREHFLDLLATSVRKDNYRCLPPVDVVLQPPTGAVAERTIRGVIPHYNVFFGPVRYRVRGDAAAGLWRVGLNIALTPETLEGMIELPDCVQRGAFGGALECRGTAYENDPGVEACPESGTFAVENSRAHLETVVRRWSTDVEGYWNRDAERFGLPVRYDFEFFLAEGIAVTPVDVRTEIRTTCGRTPYCAAMRTGWSIPILAHEVGHYLGLLDEYEALSGMLYEKTPFVGSETSRMGLSMKTSTRLYPLHHYLVLRRYHCDEPESRDPYRAILDPSTP